MIEKSGFRCGVLYFCNRLIVAVVLGCSTVGQCREHPTQILNQHHSKSAVSEYATPVRLPENQRSYNCEPFVVQPLSHQSRKIRVLPYDRLFSRWHNFTNPVVSCKSK